MALRALLISLIVLIGIIAVIPVITGLIEDNAESAAASRRGPFEFLRVFAGA